MECPSVAHNWLPAEMLWSEILRIPSSGILKTLMETKALRGIVINGSMSNYCG